MTSRPRLFYTESRALPPVRSGPPCPAVLLLRAHGGGARRNQEDELAAPWAVPCSEASRGNSGETDDPRDRGLEKRSPHHFPESLS